MTENSIKKIELIFEADEMNEMMGVADSIMDRSTTYSQSAVTRSKHGDIRMTATVNHDLDDSFLDTIIHDTPGFITATFN